MISVIIPTLNHSSDSNYSVAKMIISGNWVCVGTAAGPANLKSYNTNLKANIKNINTNLIANVKKLNTNI